VLISLSSAINTFNVNYLVQYSNNGRNYSQLADYCDEIEKRMNFDWFCATIFQKQWVDSIRQNIQCKEAKHFGDAFEIVNIVKSLADFG
jgi:hypothetical protein